MKYVPKIPDGDVNVPKESILKTFLFILFTLFIIIYLIYLLLGFFTDIIVKKIPWQYEKILVYKYFLPEKDRDIIKKEKKLQKILNGLVKYTDMKNRDFKVRIYKTDEKNALALPGGDIVVFSGILKIIGDDERKIAAILAHELGHYAHRDHLCAIGRKLILTLILTFLTKTDNQASSLFASSLDKIQLKYSRDQEKKADLYAVDLLYKRYKRIKEMIEVLNALSGYEKIPKYFSFFSTHPTFEDRIKTIKKYAKRKGYRI